MALDPNIILAGANPPPQYGSTPQQIMSMQALALRMQQLQQNFAGQKTTQQLYSNPANLEQNVLRPELIAQAIGNGSMPANYGMDMLGDVAKMRSESQRTQALSHDTLLKQAQQANDTLGNTLWPEYQDNAAKLGTKPALDIYYKHRAEMIDGLKRSGQYGAIADHFNTQVPPDTMMANTVGLKNLIEMRGKQNKYTIETDPGRNTQYRKYEDGRMTGISGEAPYVPSGYGAQTGEPHLFEGKDKNGNTVTVKPARSGTGWEDPNTGEFLPNVSVTKPVGSNTQRQLSPSKEIAVLDKDGNTVQRIAARESTTGAGWVRSDTGEIIKPPAGGKIDVGASAGAVIGSRENALLQRGLGAGMQAVSAIRNVVNLPITADAGFFGQRGQPTGILNAANETLTNKVSSQEVQAYNAVTPGLTRALAFIDSQGLAPGQRFTEQFNAEMLRDGDTQITKLLKLARQKEIVQTGMETLLANPRVAPEQRKQAEKVISDMDTAVPWSAGDVVQLMQAKPGTTLRDVGIKRTGDGGQQSARPSTATGAPYAEAPIPPAIDVVPRELRQDGKAIMLRDDSGAVHRFVVTDGGTRLRAIGDR